MRPETVRCRGFTLIEGLAALLLVAIVLPVAVRSISLSAQVASLANRRAEALALCELRLNEVMLDTDWRFGDDGGEFDDAFASGADRYRWALFVDDWADTPTFKYVRLVVSWDQRGDEQSVELGTVAYDDQGGL